ncbi:MAG: hypothetical protein ACP5TL_00700 [Candidatus Micrarchaeia archaeon]
MKYAIKINKRIKYVRVYSIVKKIGENQNKASKVLTGLFMKIFNRKGNKQEDMGGWPNVKE